MRRCRRSGSLLPALALAMLCALAYVDTTSAAQDEPVNTGYFGNVAIKGYDPVAYFVAGKALKGDEAHALKWLGARWLFASTEHRQLFENDPVRYAPQYGGHCASGMAIHGGLTKDIDPEAWTIIDGKLYLNYSKDTRELMTEGVATPEEADTRWRNYVGTPTE